MRPPTACATPTGFVTGQPQARTPPPSDEQHAPAWPTTRAPSRVVAGDPPRYTALRKCSLDAYRWDLDTPILPSPEDFRCSTPPQPARTIMKGAANLSAVNRVTLLDVALDAGVSRATASMVVRGTGRLREETRQSVRESMDRLGYVYHRGAASLRTRRSGLLGLLTTDISNPFFAVLAQGFEQAAAEGGYLTIMTNTFDNPTRQARLAQSMIEFPIDALAYTPVASADLAYRVQEFPVPILALTRGSSAGAPYLGPDDVVGGRLAGQHLIEHHGYRRIFYLGGHEAPVPGKTACVGLRTWPPGTRTRGSWASLRARPTLPEASSWPAR